MWCWYCTCEDSTVKCDVLITWYSRLPTNGYHTQQKNIIIIIFKILLFYLGFCLINLQTLNVRGLCSRILLSPTMDFFLFFLLWKNLNYASTNPKPNTQVSTLSFHIVSAMDIQFHCFSVNYLQPPMLTSYGHLIEEAREVISKF